MSDDRPTLRERADTVLDEIDASLIEARDVIALVVLALGLGLLLGFSFGYSRASDDQHDAAPAGDCWPVAWTSSTMTFVCQEATP